MRSILILKEKIESGKSVHKVLIKERKRESSPWERNWEKIVHKKREIFALELNLCARTMVWLALYQELCLKLNKNEW